jgi:hypothetical protein
MGLLYILEEPVDPGARGRRSPRYREGPTLNSAAADELEILEAPFHVPVGLLHDIVQGLHLS